MDNTIELSKGTIIKVNGCSLELSEDIKVKGSLTTDKNTQSSNKPFNSDGGAMEEFPAALFLA